MFRKEPLITGEVYHIFNKSIAKFKIFNTDFEYSRMLTAMRYYQVEKQSCRFARFIETKQIKESDINESLNVYLKDKEKIVDIIAYCIMPTHIHLILKQLKEKGISIYINNILNSYSRYFNNKYRRKGPLWESRFKSVLIKKDEYLLHLTRYVHLNPVTAYLIDKPELWTASSCKEYFSGRDDNIRICNYEGLLDIASNNYKEFLEDRISYQRDLKTIKNLIFEEEPFVHPRGVQG